MAQHEFPRQTSNRADDGATPRVPCANEDAWTTKQPSSEASEGVLELVRDGRRDLLAVWTVSSRSPLTTEFALERAAVTQGDSRRTP